MKIQGRTFSISEIMGNERVRDAPSEPYGNYPERIWVIPIDYDRGDLRNAWVVMKDEEGSVEFLRADTMKRSLSNILEILSDPDILHVDKVSFAKPILESILESRS